MIPTILQHTSDPWSYEPIRYYEAVISLAGKSVQLFSFLRSHKAPGDLSCD